MPHPNKKGRWSHLVSDDIDELHAFAEQLGLKRCWFQNKKNKNQPHYDLKESLVPQAKNLGATLVQRKDLFIFLKTHYS